MLPTLPLVSFMSVSGSINWMLVLFISGFLAANALEKLSGKEAAELKAEVAANSYKSTLLLPFGSVKIVTSRYWAWLELTVADALLVWNILGINIPDFPYFKEILLSILALSTFLVLAALGLREWKYALVKTPKSSSKQATSKLQQELDEILAKASANRATLKGNQVPENENSYLESKEVFLVGPFIAHSVKEARGLESLKANFILMLAITCNIVVYYGHTTRNTDLVWTNVFWIASFVLINGMVALVAWLEKDEQVLSQNQSVS